MSQIFPAGPGFILMKSRKYVVKIDRKFPVFGHIMKTRAIMQTLKTYFPPAE